MPSEPLSQFSIDDAKHKRLWKEAHLIFDTSSLLETYFYSDKTNQSGKQSVLKLVVLDAFR